MIVELDPITTAHNRYKSFRLRVKRSDLDKIEDADFWPQGVVVCRYFRPRNKEQNGVIGDVAASTRPDHGECWLYVPSPSRGASGLTRRSESGSECGKAEREAQFTRSRQSAQAWKQDSFFGAGSGECAAGALTSLNKL